MNSLQHKTELKEAWLQIKTALEHWMHLKCPNIRTSIPGWSGNCSSGGPELQVGCKDDMLLCTPDVDAIGMPVWQSQRALDAKTGVSRQQVLLRSPQQACLADPDPAGSFWFPCLPSLQRCPQRSWSEAHNRHCQLAALPGNAAGIAQRPEAMWALSPRHAICNRSCSVMRQRQGCEWPLRATGCWGLKMGAVH